MAMHIQKVFLCCIKHFLKRQRRTTRQTRGPSATDGQARGPSAAARVKITITTALIDFFFLGKLYLVPRMVLGCFVFIFKPWDGFRLPNTPWNKDPLDNSDAAAS